MRNNPIVFRDPLGLCSGGSGCQTKAIEEGLSNILLDSIGLVPGGEAVSVALSDGDELLQGLELSTNFVSVGANVFEGNAFGSGLAITSTAITGAKIALGVIPVVGEVVAGISILNDIYDLYENKMKCTLGE